MSWFIAIAGGMTLVALAWILRPLLRRPLAAPGVARDEANLALLRDQLAESEAELARGAIAPEQHQRTRADIERRVLEEAIAGPPAAQGARPVRIGVAVAIAIAIPAAALLGYLMVGSPGVLLDGRQETANHGEAAVSPEVVEQMVGRLAARLEAAPDDADGWALLARSYYALERFPQAIAAYGRAVKLRNDDANLYADYADALAMTRERRFDGEVLALIGQALKIDPDHPKALLLAATAASGRGDSVSAARYLEHLQRQLPPDSHFAEVVGQRVAEARAQGAAGKSAPIAQAVPGASITGRVALDAAIASNAAPTDTVFILARAPEGSRMPLAILKRQVKDLPAEFALSDEQAMSPAMRLSSFPEVVIVARVSKSGSAAPQSGDLVGTTKTVKLGTAGVRVSIDTVVP